MNWKLKFLVAIALIGCAAVFVKYPSLAQQNPNQMSSETVENALESYPSPIVESKAAPDSPSAVTTISYTGPAVAIPDNIPAGVNVPLTVAGLGTVTDLDFRFDTGGTCDATVGNVNAAVDHTFNGDLTFKLTAPSGAVSTFMARRGSTSENICGTLFDDDGGFPNISTAPTTTGTFIAGNFAPETTGPLSAFDGVNPNGVWMLNVSDNAGIDTGSLRRFSLIITDAGVLLPSLAINDVSVTEGNAGTTNANFTVTLSAAAAANVTVNFATADQTAVAPGDYTSTSGTLTFTPGQLTKTVTVPVIGDTVFEGNETFAVNLSAVSANATIFDNQGIGTIINDDTPSAPLCVFNNGGLNPQALTDSGVAAPTGSFWSEAQHPTGNTAVANTVGGFSAQSGVLRIADDFTAPVGGCTLSTVTFFAYQTGSAATPSPISAFTLRIWNGRPGDAGATVVFGDTTTNRLASSVDSGLFRIFNTVAPPPGTASGTTRKVWANTLTVNTTLPGGTYWLDWDSTATNAAAHFQPSKTIAGARNAPTDNGRQFTVATGLWADLLDTGNPVTVPSLIHDMPFYLNTLAPTSDAPVDFNGDGKTDFAVVRNIGAGASGATNQLRWFYNLNGVAGSTVVSDWGIATDRVIPEDFDGDGKDDIAVWRSAASPLAGFYILQSMTNTFRFAQFGQTGDDPSVTADYDGDNKADPAVYRVGATTGAQSTWFYRGSLNNPSGNTTFAPWGLNGDFPAPGDYDGDGRNDFVVQRGPSPANFWMRQTTAGFRVVNFGLATDVIVPGDYDGDGKTDIATARGAAGSIQWQWLPSSGGAIQFRTFGASATDLLVQGDYDGDGKTDIAIWRPAGGQFWTQATSNGAVGNFTLGATGDGAVANYNSH